jgi:Domain of unknown function (DUF4383)
MIVCVPRKETKMRESPTPASLYAGLVGGILLIAGIIGFFYSASFGSPGSVDAVFGILDVNAWHNLIHILTGALGVLAFMSGPRVARLYALAFGAVYIVVAIWGFIIGGGESILGFIPINDEDNVLHIVLGVLGVGAGATSPDVETRHARPEPGRPGAASE